MDQALKDIESERVLRKKAEITACETRLQYQHLSEEFNSVTNKYKALLQQFNSGSGAASSIAIFSMPVNNLTGTVNLNYVQDKLVDITVKNFHFFLEVVFEMNHNTV